MVIVVIVMLTFLADLLVPPPSQSVVDCASLALHH